ncbi:hypothetical protein PNOK_0740100 [Pyrrhoderma noxium]|uniref:Uncharacterized protein n=1 Tax=Pyrrhoderma noxium TaxID=2282107 RepID=A0A286UCQ7_9AGAM|nr:hypothetical protein PNOK_0740100 [Pyrrhoderma noxium]
MSLLRCSNVGRHALLNSRRSFTASAFVKSESAPLPNVGSVKPPKQPIGGFRGGIVGFLLGFSLASSFAAYHLLEEYKQASSALQTSVLELQASTEKVTAHIRRIEAVEKDLKALSGISASKDDLSRLRAEVKKLYDGLNIEFLNLRSHVWGIQQDVHALSKKENSAIRVV